MVSRAALVLSLTLALPCSAAEWRADIVPSPGRVTAIEIADSQPSMSIGSNWFRLSGDGASLSATTPPRQLPVPAGGLADGRVATSPGPIARAWLATPTKRYGHGVLGDAIEAGSLSIERRDGRRGVVTLGADAVFEDLMPRIAALGGVDRIVVVKSYLERGAALAVVDADAMAIIAETPPIGHSNAWINPAGIADFDGDGTVDIAVVRQPHVVGRLELWSWRNDRLIKTAEVTDVSNHVIGSRALGMSWTADFDGDGHPDLAVPSLDRRTLRLIAFAPRARDIATVRLPGRLATNIGATMRNGRLALVAGLEDGRLIVVHDRP